MTRVDAATPTTVTRTLWAHAVRAGRGIHWYLTNLMGDRAYDAYVAHHAAHHPGEAPLTERAFWRERMDEQDRNPGARCC